MQTQTIRPVLHRETRLPLVAQAPKPDVIAPATDALEDLASQAATAIDALVEHIAAATASARRCRDAWLEYGAALDCARQRVPSTREFNKWVIAAALNRGPARFASVRSDAMWMHRNAAALIGFKADIHHPVAVRNAARAAGYAWAFDERPAVVGLASRTPRSGTEKASSARPLFDTPPEDTDFPGVPAELHARARAMREAERRALRREAEADFERENLRRRRKGVAGISEWMSRREYHTVRRALDPAIADREQLSAALEIFTRLEPLIGEDE